jgi:WD40 repeat protein
MAKFLASVSDADGIVLSNVKEMAPVCHFECSHRIKDICWKYIEAEGQEEEQLVLFAMYNHDSSSKIIRFHIPINREFKNFTLKDIEYAVYIVPEILTSISVQKHTIGAEMFFTLGLDRHLKEFIIKEKTLISHEGLQLDPPVRESEEHEKSLGGTVLSYDGELLITFANDGIITCRNTSEFEIFLKVVAHDSLSEGVSLVCIDRECKTIYTVGADGIIKIWGWKYSSSGKKKAAEILLSSNSEAQDKKEFTEFLAQHILDLPVN